MWPQASATTATTAGPQATTPASNAHMRWAQCVFYAQGMRRHPNETALSVQAAPGRMALSDTSAP